jgi:hypothetical protein
MSCTTVREKFGSTIDGAATSKAPADGGMVA